MSGRLTSTLRIRRAKYRRWAVSRRRAVPRPVLIRLRAVGIVAVVFGIIVQSLAGWEGPAAAGVAPRVQSVVSVEDEANTLTIEVPPTAPGELSLVVLSRRGSPTDEVVAPTGWELVQRIDHPDQPVYQAVYTGPSDTAGQALQWSFSETAATSILHLGVIGAGEALAFDGTASRADSSSTQAPSVVVAEPDSLLLDLVSVIATDPLRIPPGVAAEHLIQFGSLSTLAASSAVGSGEVPATAYELTTGTPHAGIAGRILIGPRTKPGSERGPTSTASTPTSAPPVTTEPPATTEPPVITQPPSPRREPLMSADEWRRARAADGVGRRLVFEPNDGGAEPSLEYLARARGYVAVFEAAAAHLWLDGVGDAVVMRTGPDGAGPVAEGRGAPASGMSSSVVYEELYPGIDLVYLANDQELEYRFHIAPGADPDLISLRFEAAGPARLDEQGNLLLDSVDGGSLISTAPYSYQEIDGTRVTVDSGYRLNPDGTVGFVIGDHDPSLPLVIDPTFRAVDTSAAASSTSLSLDTPAGTAVGDVMIAQVFVEAGGVTFTPPWGWTLIRQDDSVADGIAQVLYHRVAGASEPPTHTFSFSASASASGAIGAFSGVDTSDPIDAHGGQANAGGSPIAPSITTTVTGTRLVALYGQSGAASFTAPTGMTERWDLSSNVSVSGHDQDYNGVGATGTRTAGSTSSNNNVGQLVALTPAADSDGDGLWDHEEDWNRDADGNPATDPGPDTDGDGTPNYLDADDDGDGIPTAFENADPNGDGDPRDALDSDRDGQPDYLDAPTGPTGGTVADEQKISDITGGLTAVIDDADAFGRAVASIGDVDRDGVVDLAVGTFGDDDGGADRGAVHILFLNADGTVKAEQKISDTTGGLATPLDNGDEFGISVAGIGDVDGDGIPDIAVGARRDDDGGTDRGAVHILFLNADGTVKAEQKISDTAGGLTATLDDSDWFGGAVAGIGDLNGDGTPDIVVGAPNDDDGGADRGAVHILFLNADGTVRDEQKISDTAGGLTASLDNSDQLGAGVAGIGDLDGDGTPDIVVGAPFDDDGGADRGAVHILLLNTDGTVRGEQKISSTVGGLTGSLDAGDSFGYAIAGVGDLDADGAPDMAVGARRDDDGGTDRGAVHILFLNSDGTVRDEQKISDLPPSPGNVLSVTQDAVSTGMANTNAFSTTISHTTSSGSDRLMLVGISFGQDNTGSVGTVTYNGVALTRVGFQDGPSSNSRVEIWRLLAPATGTADVVVNFSNTTHGGATVGVMTFTGVDQSTPLGPFAGAQGTSNGPSVTVASAAAELVFGVAAYFNASDGDFTPGDGQTEQWDLFRGSANGSGTTEAGAASVVTSWRIPRSFGWAAGGVSIKPAPNTAPVPLDDGDWFGASVAGVGDLDGDGTIGLAVGAYLDDDGGVDRGAVYVLDLRASMVVVNSTGDAGDNNPGDGYCDTGASNADADPECTLRAAIEEANASALVDTIEFAIPIGDPNHAAGTWTISPGSQFPQLAGPLTIDGTSQPGWASTPVVELNGTSAGGLSDGLRVSGDGTTIRGLAINRFGADGIEVGATASNTLIAGNHIGVSADGTIDRGNGGRGIDLSAGSGPTTVGGSEAADRNLVSGNGGDGVIVWNSSGNTIIGNFIGTDVSGGVAISNGADGIALGGGSGNNSIGRPGAGNVLSGNVNDGVEIDDTSGGNIIQANLIGLGADGSTVVPNGRHGIVLYNGANTTQIGGAGASEGNVISGNIQEGVHINGNGNAATSGNVIAGNRIGTDANGTLNRGNGTYGIHVFGGAVNTVIGGSMAGAGNTISGNGSDGVFVTGAATSGTLIQGNHIGTSSVGDAALGNSGNGVEIDWEVPNQTIGGTAAGAGNVISGNLNGIYSLWTNDMVIQGNIIGLDATGTIDLGNTNVGIRVGGDNVTIGGATTGARNVVSGNGNAGILLDSANSAVLQGNFVGTDVTGLLDRGNDSNGIYVSGTGNQIGGSVAGAGNVISGNTNDGIQTASSSPGTIIEGNTIGLGSDRSTPIPNSYRGISIYGAGARIGGSAAGAANTISANSSSGVSVITGATDVALLGNAIFGNGGIGIDLGNNGVTLNDAGDGDSGANDLLNFPELDSAVETGGTVDVSYRLDVPAGNYRIEFFTNTVADPSGYGEGETFVHAETISHSGTGSQGFSTSFAGAAGAIVTATTTEDLGGGTHGSTSEFSAVIEVNAPPTAVDDAFTTDEDTAGTVDVLANDTDPDGDPLSVTAVTQGSNGVVTDNGDGTVTYSPDVDWNGVDSFTYTISDGELTASATVTVTVTPVNDAPVAVDDFDSIAEDTSSTLAVLVNDTDVDGDTLTVVSVTQGVNGSVVINGDGTVSYTPDADWNGVDSFSYTITDGALTDTGTVTVTVAAVNDAPVAVDDNTGTDEDVALLIAPLLNDTDVDGDLLSIDSFAQPANGIVVDNGAGTLRYTPDPDWFGTDSFSYTVTDGQATATATVWVVVAAVNDAPVAADDGVGTDEDMPVSVDVLVNDFDVDGDTLTVTAVTQGSNGSVVTDNGDGTVTYSPDVDWNGVDSFTYTVSDGLLTDSATVTVVVGAVNDAPVASDDADTISEDGSSTIDVLANDFDVDGDVLSVVSVTQPANGVVVDNGDGTLTYTPDPDWNGVDSFTYTVSDGLLTDSATVTVTVTAVNDAPVAADDAGSVAEDGSVTVDVLANDFDVDGDLLFVLSVVQPANGTVVDNGDGTLTYVPDADWNGVDSFSYIVSDGALTDSATVTVTVTAVNDAPVAVDDADTIIEDGSSTIEVLANDTDVEGDTLSIQSVTQPSNGVVVDNGDGTVTYTPDPDWNGTDSYTYTITDGFLTDTATVTITVTPVNDAPVAVDDADAIAEDGVSTIDVLANDFDVENDPLTVVGVIQGANGVVVDNGDGTVTYTPDPDWNGVDSFTYTVSDGLVTDTATVTVTVAAVNDAPVAVDDFDTILEDGVSILDVLANDYDVDGMPVLIGVSQAANGVVVDNGDGTVSYTPDADWNGVDSYTYTISDGFLTDTATVTVTVTPVNDAPVAVDDVLTTDEDTAGTVGVLANDTDPDGDALTVVAVTDGVNGSVVDNGDGTVTYTPDADWNGTDSFTYVVGDGALTDTGTVWVTVIPVNDAPVAVDDFDLILEDGVSTVDVLVNDFDVDGDVLSVVSVTQGVNGSVVINGGSVSYTPDADWNGVDSFSYTITDGALTDTATVTVTVAAVNDAPVAVDDNTGTDEDVALVVAPLVNDFDVDGDVLSIDSFTQPANGVVVDNGDATLTYTPDADWNGTDSFTYTVSDGQATDTATVWVVVAAVNDAPVAADVGAGTDEDTPVTVDVLVNDFDVDGDVLSVVSVTQGVNGSVVIDGGGTVTYTPDADWNGVDSFTYTISDGALTDTATVTVSVGAVNDAPVAVDDADTIIEDGVSTVDVVANDFDVDGDTLTVVSVTQGSNGTVVNNGDGTVTYTPDPDWNGTDTYTYTISDGLLTDSVTVTVTVTAVNDAPVAADDAGSVAEDGSVVVDVLVNDVDVDGDVLFVVSVVQPANATVTDNGDGTLTYVPDPDWNGVDSFSYIVSDGALTDSATVTITVTAVNDAPVASDDADTIIEDGSSTIEVLANDFDVDGDVLSVASVTQGANGSVVVNGDGTITYTPDPDWNGTDTYTYTITDGELTATATVTITVTPVNDAPVAVHDFITIAEDTPTIINVGSNDYDVDGDALFVTGATANRGGTVAVLGAMTIRYTPSLDFNGTESVTYTISDGQLTATGTVTITVLPVNDSVIAVADSATIDEDSDIIIDVLANDIDVDGDVLSIISFTQPSNAVVTRAGRQLRFVPDRDRYGTFQFAYTVSDGQSASVGVVTVTVRPVNDAPVAVDDSFTTPEDITVAVDVLANDYDVDGDTLRVVATDGLVGGTASVLGDGRVQFVPTTDFNGPAGFRYTVSDGALTSTARVTISVTPVNDAPVFGETRFTIEHTAAKGSEVGYVTAVDPEGAVVVFSGASDVLTIDPDGRVLLTGEVAVGDILRVLVTATDSSGAAASTWIEVVVTAGKRAPTVRDQRVELAADFPDGGVVVAMTATDPDGDPVTWSMKGGPGWTIGATDGRVGKGVIPGIGETLAIPITATDPDGASGTGLLTVFVVEPEAANRPPVAVDDVVRMAEDEVVDLDVLANDSDPDGDPLTATLLTAPAYGAIIDDEPGALVYAPSSNWFGEEVLRYRVSDGRGGADEATVRIVVTPVNDRPVVGSIRAEVPAGQTSRIPLPPIVDVDGDALVIEAVGVRDAEVELDRGTDEIVFEPSPGFEGSTEFEIRATDPSGASGTGGVAVDVVVGKTSVSVEVLSTGGLQARAGLDEAVRNASPGGLALFMPSVTEALAAVWATRLPLVVLLGLLAMSLFGSRRLHIRLGNAPISLAADGGRTWSVVLVQEGQTLPVFTGPDRSNEVVARLHPLRCDLRGSGELSQTGGVLWVEIEGDGASGWVEAGHVVANPRDPLPLGAAAHVLEHLVGAVRGEPGLEQWISGRGLFVAHHAPPFRLTRKRVESAMLDPTPFRWWEATGTRPDVVGSIGEVVVGPLLEAMVQTSIRELSTTPVPGEVLYEFTNFETVALGTPEAGWILCFERGLDGVPLLVGLMKRGAINPASLVLEPV